MVPMCAQFEAHVTDMLSQLFQIEKDGLTLDLILPLPPKIILMGQDETDEIIPCVRKIRSTQFPDPEVEDSSQTSSEGARAFLSIRHPPDGEDEVLVTGNKCSIAVVVCLDGGTWGATSGKDAKISSEQNSFLDTLNRKQHQQPGVYMWLECGESIMTKSEDLAPGDAGYLRCCITLNRKSLGASIAKITEPPERRIRINDINDINECEIANQQPAPDQAQRRRPRGAAQGEQAAVEREARQQAAAAAMRGRERSDVVTEWAHPMLRAFGWLHETHHIHSPVDAETGCTVAEGELVEPEGLQRYGIELPVTEKTLVRMLRRPEKRILTDAAWKSLPVVARAALCIMHTGMRMGERLWRQLLAALISLYEGGKRKVIDRFLNRVLVKMKIRRIAVNRDTGFCYPHSFDGSALAAWVADLYVGLVEGSPNLYRCWRDKKFNSRFLQGVADCFNHLPNREEDWGVILDVLPILRHFAIGFTAALTYRPTPRDYDLVDVHLRMMPLMKAILWPDENPLSWYDNHCLYHMAGMMRQWGSLAMVDQEGMEGCQAVLNSILRLGNGFANAGAIPVLIQEQGEQRVAEYMEERLARKPSPARWVHEQMQLQSHADMVDTFDTKLRLAGRTVYAAERMAVLWDRYQTMLRCTIRICALFRLRRARVVSSPYYAELLKLHHSYWATVVELSAPDLAAKERRLQLRDGRRRHYRDALRESAMCARLSAPLYRNWNGEGAAFCAVHPGQRVQEGAAKWLQAASQAEGKRAYKAACDRWAHYCQHKCWPER